MEKDKIRKILGEKDNTILKLEKDLERLKRSLRNEHYGLAWIDVPEAFEDDVENKLPIIKTSPKFDIKNKDKKPTHVIIEGENYHALTCLNYTHKGKIDIIYIDPPYNTGSDGFRYKDKRVLDRYPDGTDVPKDHPLRHSYWLSFMRKRLELSRDLLAQDGVIFISIDDNEFAQLKLLCDQILGASNYVGTITWERKRKGSHLSRKLTKKTEYVHIYAKKGEDIELFGSNVDQEGDGPLIKRTNTIKTLIIPKDSIVTKLPNGSYKTGKYGTGSSAAELLKKVVVKNEKFTTDLHIRAPFVWSQAMVDDQVSMGALFFIKTKNFSLRVRKGDLDGNFKALSDLFLKEVGTNEDAKSELAKILNVAEDSIPIDYPKPVSFIKKLLESRTFTKKSPIVLDFFAGSGTTGHAVMEICHDNKGSMPQFILVTNNEGNIASKACYPRLKKVMNGYAKAKGLGGSLKYYKVGFVGENSILRINDKDKLSLAHHACEMLAIAENTLEVVEKNNYFEIYSNDKQFTAVYFREQFDQFDQFVNKVLSLKKLTTVYIFSWENDPFVEEFDDSQNIVVKTIPEPILEIYRRIYNL